MSILTKDGMFLLEQISDVIIIADMETKRLCHWNTSASQIYGINDKTFSLEDIF